MSFVLQVPEFRLSFIQFFLLLSNLLLILRFF